MKLILNDGGRAEAGFRGTTGDCVVRAIAIAANKPYIEVYNDLAEANKRFGEERRGKEAKRIREKGPTPRSGTFRHVYEEYLKTLGFIWKATMLVGQGCKVHLREEELPKGRIIARVSKHLVAVIDGVMHDVFDCSRGGTRCVYGYYYKPDPCYICRKNDCEGCNVSLRNI